VGYCHRSEGIIHRCGCCPFHYVGDSIIDDNCSLAAGTVLAILRFDEKNIKVNVGEESIDTGLDKLG